MEAIKLCRLDTPIIFIEARINLSRFVVTGCAAKTSATVTFPSLNLISLFAFCFNIWLNGVASHNSNFFSDKLVLTSVTPASSAPVLQTPKATSSTLYFDSLTVNAGNGGFLHCIQMDTSVN